MVAFSSLNEKKEVSLKLWHAKGEHIIIFLNAQIKDIVDLSKKCSTTRAWSCKAGITGAVCVTAGIIMAPFTSGASAALLSLCGSGLSFAAGAVNSGTRVFEIKKENVKADMIMARLREFLEDSQSLLEVIYDNKLETKKWISLAMESAQELLPAAGSAMAVLSTGAHSAMLQGKPTTSYFHKTDTPETCFNGKMNTSTLANICAVVGVIAALYSMVAFWRELEENKKITDGRALSQFAEKLIILRDTLQKQLADTWTREPEQERANGTRHRHVIAEASQ